MVGTVAGTDAVHETLVIGAGPAGLACAGALAMRGRKAHVVERRAHIASAWHQHYDRLHLHTHRNHSALPGLKMPTTAATYPARREVIAYLESYAAHFDIAPQLSTEVLSVRQGDGYWTITTDQGTDYARQVIFATGLTSAPYVPTWPGLEEFPGTSVHSSDYKNPQPYLGQKVLVVGFGNSGGEIAMDLADHGVTTALAVKGPVNVIPRDILGIPILSFAIFQQHLPYKLVDALNGPLIRFLIGDLEPLGLPKSSKGPAAQVVEDGRIPLLNIGTIERIRDGAIQVMPGIARIEGARVVFTDGRAESFDAIVLATGYRTNLSSLLPDHADVLTAGGAPRMSGAPVDYPGLYFCGYRVAPTGQLREIGIEAERIAASIAASIATP